MLKDWAIGEKLRRESRVIEGWESGRVGHREFGVGALPAKL